MFRRSKHKREHQPLPDELQKIILSYIPLKSSESNLHREEKTVAYYTKQGLITGALLGASVGAPLGDITGKIIGTVQGAGIGFIWGLFSGNIREGFTSGMHIGKNIGGLAGALSGTVIGSTPTSIIGVMGGYTAGIAIKAGKEFKGIAHKTKELVCASQKKKDRENQNWASFFINMKDIPIPSKSNQNNLSHNKRKKFSESEETHNIKRRKI